jgi:hypothetical protein
MCANFEGLIKWKKSECFLWFENMIKWMNKWLNNEWINIFNESLTRIQRVFLVSIFQIKQKVIITYFPVMSYK